MRFEDSINLHQWSSLTLSSSNQGMHQQNGRCAGVRNMNTIVLQGYIRHGF